MANESPIQVWQKSPNNFRLDFPGFKDVLRHKLCKGIITDFKVTNYDPFTVESLVKVKLEDAEIDPAYGDQYIPLFYRPKEGYWDDDWNNIKAEDFDEENKCFRMAWMSFRCDDEVVVLTEVTDHQPKRGKPNVKPICVLGFYDNYPRIGEDVVKVERAEPFQPLVMPIEYGRMSQLWNEDTLGWYDFPDDLGPDGLPLNLLKEVESKKSDTYYWIDQYVPIWFWPRNGYELDIFSNERIANPLHPREWCTLYDGDRSGGDCIWGGGDCRKGNPYERIFAILVGNCETDIVGTRCMAHFLPVGPILYVALSIWETYWRYHGSWSRGSYIKGTIMCEDLKEWLATFQDGLDEWDKPGLAFTKTPPPLIEVLEDRRLNFEKKDMEDLRLLHQLKAALYTKERYEEAKNMPLKPQISWPLFKDREGKSFWLIDHFPYFKGDFYFQRPPLSDGQTYYDAVFAADLVWHMRDRLMIRPHTKEELQECGLWPAFGPEG